MRATGVNTFIEGDEQLRAALAEILGKTEDISGAWKTIYHPEMLRGASQFFVSQGEGKWRDLTARYARYKASKGRGSQILIGTPPRKKYPRRPGELRDSLTSASDPYHIFESYPRYMHFGTRDPLANIHFAKVGIRKRKPLDAKAASMQEAFRRATEQHAQMFGYLWNRV